MKPCPCDQPALAPAAPGHDQSGNVLFYILIGIVLFAALSFAVANIMNSGAADPARETRMLAASDLIQYGDGLKRAVQGMHIRSIPDAKISFESPRLKLDYAHPNAAPQRCNSDDCRVFTPAGGGFTYIPPVGEWLDKNFTSEPLYGHWFFPRGVCVEGAGTGDSSCASDTTDNEELVAILPYIRRDLCREINDRLGITNPGGEPPVATGNAWPSGTPLFVGTFTEDSVIARGGATSGCLRGAGIPSSSSYFYFKVLLSR